MTQPLVLFWGLLTIPNWYMDWVLTNAQLELLICDQPLIVYSKSKNGEKKHTKREMDDVMKKWEEKRKKQGKSTDFTSGEKVNLNDFLRTGMDAFKHTKTE